MADAMLSAILQQLVTIAAEEATQRVRLLAYVEVDVQRLRRNLEAIRAVLEDAEGRQIEERSVRIWLNHLKRTAYDMEDVLDQWNIELLKVRTGRVGTFSNIKAKVCPCFLSSRLEMALSIKFICQKLREIALDRTRFGLQPRPEREQPRQTETTSNDFDMSVLIGRDKVKEDIRSSLLCEPSEEGQGNELKTISVVGMGGLGKTALAQLVYNDDRVKQHFDSRIWVCVSDCFDEKKIAKAIILNVVEGLQHDLSYALDSLPMQNLLQRTCESIHGKKFFLVLDDVWDHSEHKWERLKQTFKHGAPGSRILLTTRKDEVANMMENSHVFCLEKLIDEDCWKILRHFAFPGRNQEAPPILEEIGRRISARCQGLPLAAKTIGCLLRFKSRTEWVSVLDDRKWEYRSDIGPIFNSLLLSYWDLPSPVRRCFLYCASFPKDFVIFVDHLVRLWMAQGFLEYPEGKVTGYEYFDLLAARSFFQDFAINSNGTIYTCKMHNLVHDFAVFLAEGDAYHYSPSLSDHGNVPRYLTADIGRHFIWFREITKLRSIILFSEGHPETSEVVWRYIFVHARFLRVLDMNWSDSCVHLHESIPQGIKKLIHLRLLNLSFSTRLRTLPESLCKLFCLQSLDLKGCESLEKLPDGMGNLTSLRFLRTSGCRSLTGYPKGVGRLTNLKDVYEISVTADRNDPKEFSLGDLENMDHLCTVWMKLKGNAIDTGEATRAKFENKMQLRDFRVYLDGDLGEDAVIQAFNLPSSINVHFCNADFEFQ